MKKQFSERKTVKVYFDVGEYAKIEARAHGSVSRYIRHIVLAELDGAAAPRIIKHRSLGPTAFDTIPGLTTAPKIPPGPPRCSNCGDLQIKHYGNAGRCQVNSCSCEAFVAEASPITRQS